MIALSFASLEGQSWTFRPPLLQPWLPGLVTFEVDNCRPSGKWAGFPPEAFSNWEGLLFPAFVPLHPEELYTISSSGLEGLRVEKIVGRFIYNENEQERVLKPLKDFFFKPLLFRK